MKAKCRAQTSSELRFFLPPSGFCLWCSLRLWNARFSAMALRKYAILFSPSRCSTSGGYETRRISPPIRFTRSSGMSSRSSSTARISRLGLGGVGGDGEAGRSSGLDSMVSTCDSACDTSCVPELELTGSIMLNAAASKTGSGNAEGGRGSW